MAGYVPQAINLRLSDPNIIFDLLKKAEAKALIRDSSVSMSFEECPVIVHSIVNSESIGHIPNVQLPILTANGSPDDILLVFHTSGSTSGIPKLVPYSRRWMDSNLKKAWEMCYPKRQDIPDVTTWLGSVCHMAQNVCMSITYGEDKMLTRFQFSWDSPSMAHVQLFHRDQPSHRKNW